MWLCMWVEELGALQVLEVSIIKHMLVVPLALKLRSSSLIICNSSALFSTFLGVTDVIACKGIALCGAGGDGATFRWRVCHASAFDIQALGHHLSQLLHLVCTGF